MRTPLSRRDRDAGLERVKAITRWAAAGALAATGLFAGLASLSGRGSTAAAKNARVAGAQPGGGSSVTARPQDDNGDGEGVNQPTPAPTPAVLPATSGNVAPIVSGAS